MRATDFDKKTLSVGGVNAEIASSFPSGGNSSLIMAAESKIDETYWSSISHKGDSTCN